MIMRGSYGTRDARLENSQTPLDPIFTNSAALALRSSRVTTQGPTVHNHCPHITALMNSHA
jgi:hypothetical protein